MVNVVCSEHPVKGIQTFRTVGYDGSEMWEITEHPGHEHSPIVGRFRAEHGEAHGRDVHVGIVGHEGAQLSTSVGCEVAAVHGSNFLVTRGILL